MRDKLVPAWSIYRANDSTLRRASDVFAYFDRMEHRYYFRKEVERLLGQKYVTVEWQEDGGCIIAGTMLFSLT
ncbi:MAG: hypothetical protein ACYC36_02565 [Bellilinea sp.]